MARRPAATRLPATAPRPRLPAMARREHLRRATRLSRVSGTAEVGLQRGRSDQLGVEQVHQERRGAGRAAGHLRPGDYRGDRYPAGDRLRDRAKTSTTVVEYDYSYHSTSAEFSAIGWILTIIGYIAVFFVVAYMHAGLVSGCLDIADGKPVSIGTFFKPRNVGTVVLTSFLLAVAAMVLSCTIVGPLVLAFFAQFAIAFVVDRSLSPIESIKASIATVRGELGNSALSWLVQYAAVLIGELACLVGLVVGVPVAALVQVYTYRKLTGGPGCRSSSRHPGRLSARTTARAAVRISPAGTSGFGAANAV
ncbi:hypothetical protein NIIDMKKI_43940 [Mycobacterium kansasii]|uniref:Uncharacterized protein n=1 Tax=Mycobacterium kansasii TaxID=1768 RepID=A0A7G1IKK1_MYCKA|nr:hypothetical protein NIIDMKKI_43940 [Mycobacterium kansasii]